MKYVPKAVTRAGGRAYLRLSAASPTLLVVGGVVGFGATAVMAARASKRTDPVIESHQKSRMQIHEMALSKETERKQIVQLYTETTIELAKIYGPTIVVGTLSASSILYGHKILRARHVATMMAYSGLQDQFASYRSRVARTLGESVEQEIYNGAHGEYVEDENHKGEYKLEMFYDEADADEWLRPWFDERNENCRVDPGGNFFWLKAVQAHMQTLLDLNGYLYLNEALKALGMPQTPEGQVAGWMLDGHGDGVVDFGFMTGTDPHTLAFRNGEVRDVRLNFNIDGNIQQMLVEKKYKQYPQLSS